MLQIAGVTLIVVILAGALSGGGDVLDALPREFAIVAGSGLGVLLLANDRRTAGRALAGLALAFRGPRWSREDYAQLLQLLQSLMLLARREGVVSVERRLDSLDRCDLFAAAPKVRNDVGLCDMIRVACDHLAFGAQSQGRGRQAIERAAQSALDPDRRAASALHGLADTLPALGIVAAVIGVVRALASLDLSPEVLGPLVAAALLGTLLGVVLAYGVVGPLAARFEQIVDTDAERYAVADATLNAFLDGASPSQAIAAGRAALRPDMRPADPSGMGVQNLELARQARRDAA
ncbi:MAG: motility-associated protein [Pseudomonadota bacterium]